MKSIKTSALLYATLIGLLTTSHVWAASDSETFKEFDQAVKAMEDKVTRLKADDKKVAAADKMKDEDRNAAIKEITEAIEGPEKNIGILEAAKRLTPPHAKQLKRRIEVVKTFLAADKKKNEAKNASASKPAAKE